MLLFCKYKLLNFSPLYSQKESEYQNKMLKKKFLLICFFAKYYIVNPHSFYFKNLKGHTRKLIAKFTIKIIYRA